MNSSTACIPLNLKATVPIACVQPTSTGQTPRFASLCSSIVGVSPNITAFSRLKRVLVFLLTVCFLFPCVVAYSDSFTFDQALANMQERSETLMASQDDIHQREAERAAAAGLRYPKATAEMRYTTLDAPITVGIDSIPIRIQVQDSHFWKGEVKVTQPLYAGGRIDAANRAAQARVNEANAESQRTEEGLVTELARRYYGLCLAKRACEVQAYKVKAMEDHHYRAKRLMEEGLIARTEYLSADVALANAKLELQTAERDVVITSEGLSNIVVSETSVDPVSPLFIVRDLESRETFQSYIGADHPALQLLAAKQDLAHQGVRAEQGEQKPTVYLFGMHELVPDDLTMLDPKWAMGVGAQITLFDGFQARNKVAAARAVEQKVTHLQEKVRRDLKSLVLKQFEETQKARDQYDTLGTTIELARENLRVRTRAFEEGLATSLEVVDATLSLARAQLGLVKAAYDFDYAFFQLLEAAGRTNRYHEYMARAILLDTSLIAQIAETSSVPKTPDTTTISERK